MSFLDKFKKQNTAKAAKKRTEKSVKKVDVVKDEKKETVGSLKPKVESNPVLSPKSKKEGKNNKIKKDNTKDAYKILISPLITEKATDLVSENKYVFEVARKTNKVEIKKAMRDVYGLEPLAVNIINSRGKEVVYGRTKGKKSPWKKAVVTLKKGDKIEIYEGV